MRRTNVIILCVALAMGMVAALLARNMLLSRTANATDSTTIVVTTAAIAFGVPITEDKIAEMPWASSTLPTGAFATKQELLKDGRRVALAPHNRNEPVLRSKISAPGQRGSLSSLLEEGKRAVTVRVDDVRGVAGFILPGDRVDVVLTRGEGGAGAQRYTDVILQNAKVLAVDQIINERPDQATVVAKVVTLEVTGEEAQKVVLATDIGRLSLVLQQAGSSNGEAGRRITEKDLSTADRAPATAPAAVTAVTAVVPAPLRSELSTVSIIRGMKREEYTVNRSN